MDASPALAGWGFHDRTRTSAEIIRDLYHAIRQASGQTVVIGCNTVGHLAAGIFDGQRIGDDVSGKLWERTRRMGVNALAFRLPQHGTFFSADPDCIPITAAVPWVLTRQWLDLVARSGAAVDISPGHVLDREQKAAVREAFTLAASGGDGALPDDGLETRTPSIWKGSTKPMHRYNWLEPEGAYPFEV